ncbi:SDR family NAD(P)-dependent oxidoreductase [Hydrogenibacillus schlegelii]|uniref:Oxidoreductase, short-chain dehydrogenase/reductase family n=1 Tax=Hydrogenibacillus schlegelii TaxID=1484 RepID=A0A132N387_HYDSH|nr:MULTISPECIES: SDR family NAD(P)-dependent oxidoreductase [Hydrogenibacillus]KWX04611.1 hypothetical protein TR75_08240 [Hydrogenibacillus schlegelii]OAR03212.1 hypothetical protein SA87_04785 [Hydrogenibacillus schlegelii]PTQ53706.1 MAG: oxidoreductase, short-chain dehydrogenase/reductase family [Hydrogenibacillus schlegelii]QZA32009.1 SDR family NAD(P)-dependent oxidoreductase [Hydrogenibacillus sp. N12]
MRLWSLPLRGRVVVLTGASSGFGERTARRLAVEGARLVLAARRAERLEALRRNLPTEAVAVSADVTDPAARRRIVEAALSAFGRIDVLIHNAGLGRLDWLDNLAPDEIDRMIDVNFRAPIHFTREALPHLVPGGHVVFVASLASFTATPPYVIYAATKFGLKGFADALRRELRPRGLRVTAVYPAPARTEFTAHNGESVFLPFVSHPRWLFLDPDRVARAIVAALKRPRAHVFVPGWIRPIAWAEGVVPGLVDAVVGPLFVRPFWAREARRRVSPERRPAP